MYADIDKEATIPIPMPILYLELALDLVGISWS
jgi:hypothetical protein